MKRFHVHLHVNDLDKNIGFYSALFNQPPTRTEGDYAKWMLEDPPVNFAISTRGTSTGLDHLGIQVSSADELEAAPPVTVPADASGEWFGAGTGWGYGERIAVKPSGQDAGMLPHAEDLLTLARFAFERDEAIPADQAAPVYLRDKVAQTKAERRVI